jgi:quercetin dioxygenase-like cupin family protein
MLATEDRPNAMGVEALETGAATNGWALAPLRPQRLHLPSRRNPLLAMAAGLLITAMALLNLVAQSGSPSGAPGPGTGPSVPGPAGMAIGGPSDVQAQLATYAPGQSSGWHAHSGLHAVVVLSGTLTIVESGCEHRTFRPGESYVGGREVHLAMNQTAYPLEMAITYMFAAGVSHNEFHLPAPAPAGCQGA